MKYPLPARHPFKKIDNIFQLEKFETEWHGEDIPRELWPKKPLLESVEIPHTELANKYFGKWQLNDSPISSLRISQNSVHLDLVEYEGWRLSTALRGNVKQVPPTLAICFVDLCGLKVCKSDRFGRLRSINRSIRSVPKRTNEYVYDRVLKWDENSKQIALCLHAQWQLELIAYHDRSRRTATWHSPELYLLIEFKDIFFEERQRDSLVAEFGEEAGEIYDLVDATRPLISQGPFSYFEDLVSERKLPKQGERP